MTGGRATADVGSAVAGTGGRSTPVGRALDAAAAAGRSPTPSIVGLGIALAFVWQSLVRAEHELGVQRTHLMLAFVTFPVWIVAFSLNKLYQARAVERPTEEFRRIINASLLSVGVMVGARRSPSSSRRCPGSGSCRCSCSCRCCWSSSAPSPGGSSPGCAGAATICRPILIVGTDADAIGLLHAAQRSPHLGYRVVGFVGPDDIGSRGGVSVLGGIDETAATCSRRPARPAC